MRQLAALTNLRLTESLGFPEHLCTAQHQGDTWLYEQTQNTGQ